ncbi:MAG: 2-oxoacid:acceptor oxidoreductase family protein [Candidatus Heimdallarchaeota archaeon]
MYIAAKEIVRKIPKAIKDKTIVAPLLTIAEQAGNIRAANMVLAGILNQLFKLASQESFIKAIEYLLPIRHHALNVEAFRMGEIYDLTQENDSSILEQADICRIKE